MGTYALQWRQFSRNVNPCPCPQGVLKDQFQVLVLVLEGSVLVLVFASPILEKSLINHLKLQVLS